MKSPVFETSFNTSATGRTATSQCIEYRASDHWKDEFPELIFDLGEMKIMTHVQIVSRAELMAGCGALFSSYLNGIEVATSATPNPRDFNVCEHSRIPVLNEIGGAIDVMPRVGTEIWCGSRQPKPVRYVRITRNSDKAASDRWVICHLGIYALNVPKPKAGGGDSIRDKIGFTGGFGGGSGFDVIDLDGDWDVFDSNSILNDIIDGIVDDIEDATGLDINIDHGDSGHDDFTDGTTNGGADHNSGNGSKDSDKAPRSEDDAVDLVIDNDLLRKLGYYKNEVSEVKASEKLYEDRPYYFIPLPEDFENA